MSATAAQPGITELLEMEGARPAGARRFDCPDCGGRRTVAVDEGRGLFHCHHAGCDFRGGIGTLRRRLGLRREWLPHAECLRQQRERERADRAAWAFYQCVKALRFELLARVRSLGSLELWAHDAGADDPAAWDALARVYSERPALLAKLGVLENRGAADLIRFLSAGSKVRERVISRVIEHGGLHDRADRFVEVCP